METGRISEGSGGSPGLLSSGSDKGESGQFSAENHIAHRGSDNHPEAGWRGRFSARFFMDLPGSGGRRYCLDRHFRPERLPAFPRPMAENHRVHDPARQEGEQAGNDQRAEEDRNHRLAWPLTVPAGCTTASTSMIGVKIDSRWIGLNGPTRRISMDPERADATAASAAPRSSRWSGAAASPWGCELHDAERKRRHGREGVQRDRPGGAPAAARG